MQLTVAQHIYSNVPKARSPHKKRGYQTLFHTQSALSRSEQLTLEERCQYYFCAENPIKWQQHILGDKVVLTRTVPLVARDEFGRSGRYLAHSLIFSAEQVHALDYATCDLWREHLFINSLDAAFAQGDMRTGNIPMLAVEVDQRWVREALYAAHHYAPQMLQQVLDTVWHVADMTSSKQPLYLHGDSAAQLQALKICILLSHPAKRLMLTFDTQSAECSWATKDFWARGGIDGTPMLSIATGQLDISGPQHFGDQNHAGRGSYERWLAELIRQRRLHTLHDSYIDALHLEAAIAGATKPVKHIPAQLGLMFTSVNLAETSARVRQVLPCDLSADAHQLFDNAIQQDAWGDLCWVTQPLSQKMIARKLHDWIISFLDTPLARQDVKNLTTFAESCDDKVLLALIYSQNNDKKRLAATLPLLTEQDYVAFGTVALSKQVVDAADLFTPAHIKAWVTHFGQRLDPNKLQTIWKQTQKESADEIDSLTPLVKQLPHKSCEQWAKWLHKYDGDAPRLRAALAPFRKPTLLERLQGLWS